MNDTVYDIKRRGGVGERCLFSLRLLFSSPSLLFNTFSVVSHNLIPRMCPSVRPSFPNAFARRVVTRRQATYTSCIRNCFLTTFYPPHLLSPPSFLLTITIFAGGNCTFSPFRRATTYFSSQQNKSVPLFPRAVGVWFARFENNTP